MTVSVVKRLEPTVVLSIGILWTDRDGGLLAPPCTTHDVHTLAARREPSRQRTRDHNRRSVSERLKRSSAYRDDGTNQLDLRAPLGRTKQSGVTSRGPFARPMQITVELGSASGAPSIHGEDWHVA